jgi:hypothetical protein
MSRTPAIPSRQFDPFSYGLDLLANHAAIRAAVTEKPQSNHGHETEKSDFRRYSREDDEPHSNKTFHDGDDVELLVC